VPINGEVSVQDCPEARPADSTLKEGGNPDALAQELGGGLAMHRTMHRWGLVLLTAGLLGWTGCAASGGGSGGGGGGATNNNDNAVVNDNNDNAVVNDNNDNSGGPSPGFAAFSAGGCTACHTSTSNNFANSTIDDIIDTLLGEKPHPGGEFGDLTEEEIDLITEFLLDVMLGDDDLDGGDDDNVNDNADNDNENDNLNDNENDNSDGGGGGGGGGDDADYTAAQVQAWFDQVWTDFDRNYSHFATKGVDWDALRDEYADEFNIAMTESAFLARLSDLLAELRDLHIWIEDAQGNATAPYMRTAEQNFPNDNTPSYFPQELSQVEAFPFFHSWLENNLAYIAIDTFSDSEWDGLRTSHLNGVFSTYAGAAGMVIDVRRNNGGNELIAKALAGYLTQTAYVYGYHRLRNPGPDHADFGDWVEHSLEPAQDHVFTGPAVCLIGETNMSSAEWFVLMMLENPNAIILIGDTTRGSSGSPQPFSLDNGITYYIPSWEAYRADQTTKIEDVGVSPTAGYAISPGQGTDKSYTSDRDLVLERGIDALTP
jgi:hypothetical protein